jgi:hypothetical protein
MAVVGNPGYQHLRNAMPRVQLSGYRPSRVGLVGDLASHGEGEPSEDVPFALWNEFERFWESLGLPERPLWNVGGVGQRPAAEKVKLAALPIGLLAAAGGFIGVVVWLGAWMNNHWGVYAVVPQAVLMLVAVSGAAVERRRRWE